MPGQECLQPHITSTPGQIPFLHQNQMQPSLQQSKDGPATDVVTHHIQQQTLNQSQLKNTLGSIVNQPAVFAKGNHLYDE